MPAFVVWILGALGPVLMSVVGRVLLALGIGIATFTGVDLALDSLKARIISDIQGLPAVIVGILGLLRLDQAILTVFSAFMATVAIRATQGAVSKWVLK